MLSGAESADAGSVVERARPSRRRTGIAVAMALTRAQRTKRLRERFGPEYERAINEMGDKRQAEDELDARLAHVNTLQIRPLTAEEVVDFPDYELTDSLGKTGVEQSYEDVLRGANGAKNVEVDAFGRVVRTRDLEEAKMPRSGAWKLISENTDFLISPA